MKPLRQYLRRASERGENKLEFLAVRKKHDTRALAHSRVQKGKGKKKNGRAREGERVCSTRRKRQNQRIFFIFRGVYIRSLWVVRKFRGGEKSSAREGYLNFKDSSFVVCVCVCGGVGRRIRASKATVEI